VGGDLPLWAVYVSMPLVGAVIGYLTKVVAVEMMFRPLEFRGVPPVLGWQGVIPRFAPRMAEIATDLVLSRLLTARGLFDRIDGRELTTRLREPIRVAVEELVRDVMVRYQPLLWASLPESAREKLIGYTLPRWEPDEQAAALLASFAASFPLRRPSHITTPEMARYLLTRAEGTIGELTALLTDAAVAAIESGEEAINQATLLMAPYLGPSERRRLFERELA
jgi:hypothetical protein